MSRFLSLLFSLSLLISVTAQSLMLPVSANPVTLRKAADSRNFLMGSAGSVWRFNANGSYQQTLADQYNFITPENELKWEATEPQPGKFTFYWGDQIIAFAESNKMRIHGHTLVWFNALPNWVKNGNFTRDELIAILKRHIQTVVGHYKGRIAEWDVVNEAIEHQGKGLRDNVFLRVIGPEYIAMSFQWAHEADPNAILFYNDYGTEIWPVKSATQYALLLRLLRQRIPVQAVGLQMHEYTDTPIPKTQYAAELRRLASLGLRVGITEFTASGTQPYGKPLSTRLDVQANNYQNALSACLSVRACKSFTTWGIGDSFSNEADHIPLIMDESLNPKPAYHAVMRTLRSR